MRFIAVFVVVTVTGCPEGNPGETDRDDDSDGTAREGEGEGETGEGEGETGEGEGETGEGEGEGEPGRTPAEVCERWRSFEFFSGDAYVPNNADDVCDIGTLAEGAQSAAIARVNLYRWLAGLPAVSLATELVEQQQACAALLNGIGRLDHHPPPESQCYTDAGSAGAGSSNLAMGTDVVYSVDLFVGDQGIPSLGHRRWVLNPAATVTAFGNKGAFTCMYSFSNNGFDVDPEFVAWPPPGPVPVDAAYGRFSFATSRHEVTQSTRVLMSVDGAEFVEAHFDSLGFGFGSLWTTIAFEVPDMSPWDIVQPGRNITVRVVDLSNGTVEYTIEYVDCP